MSRSRDRQVQVFRLLQRLFPAEFRRRFGDDQAALFRDQLRAQAGAGARARYWLRVAPSMLRGALMEHLDQWRERPALSLTAHIPPTRDSMFATLAQDLAFAARMLRRSPGFTLVAAVLVALGTGAITTTYSALHALVLRPLPGTRDGGQVIGLQLFNRDGGREMTLTRTVLDRLATDARGLEGLGGWNRSSATLQGSGDALAVNAVKVTGNLFGLLGVRPSLGRLLAAADDAPGGTRPVAVIAWRFWQSHFGGDPAIVGRTVQLNGAALTIVGVTAPGFLGVMPMVPDEVYVPMAMDQVLHPDRGLDAPTYLRPVGRLRPGASTEGVTRELTARLAALIADPATPERDRHWARADAAMLRAVPEDARGPFAGFLSLLVAASALVLMIASVNVAAMLSARALARAREMTVRRALGASRWRLVRQLLTETLILFALGSAGGVAIAVATTSALEELRLPVDRSPALEISPDPGALGVSLGVTLVVAIVFGLAPALRASAGQLGTQLRDGGAGAGRRGGSASRFLVVAQLAASLVLLVTAGLFLRGLDQVRRIPLGFEPEGVHAMSVNLQAWGTDTARARQFLGVLRDRAARLPGVTEATYSAFLPMSASGYDSDIVLPNAALGSDGRPRAERVSMMPVSDGYFAAVRHPLRAGRDFFAGEADLPRAIVNQTFVDRFWPGESAIGRSLVHAGRTWTVVGVAADARYRTIAEVTPPVVFLPLGTDWLSNRQLLVRSSAPDAVILPAMQALVRSIDPSVPRPLVTSLPRANAVGVLPQRIAAIATSLMGAIGLLMATVGLYGVMAWGVGQRAREIGVRMALGATRAQVLQLVLGDGLRLVLTGTLIGLVVAVAVTRFLKAWLLTVNPLDALAFGGTAILLVAVAAMAGYLPARKAAVSDPMVVLRRD